MTRRDSVPPEGRDQDATSFAEILQELLSVEPRAVAAVLIDSEGETVDYASSLPSYFAKVAAATLRVVLDDVAAACGKLDWGALTQAVIRARRRSFFVRPLPDGYALVLVLRRRVVNVSTRAVVLAACRLCKEAGWPTPAEESIPWHVAEIETRPSDRFRPLQMKAGDGWESLEVLGSVVGLAAESGETGYRCRLQGGAEVTLVRESTGTWFIDQPARGLSGRLGPESVPPPATSSQSPRPSAAPRSPDPAANADASVPEETPPETRVGTSGETRDMWAKEAKRARKF
jgi:predicted regulator of Ras-like GTPase activity (Roadblock/LC7/MglB family)